VSPATVPGAGVTFGEVVMQPGEGHGRHNHPGSEEILYVLSGTGEQMVDDEPPFRVGPGDTIYIGAGVFHSTVNTGWSPMHVLALYNPAGPELGLQDLPDHRPVPAGGRAATAAQAPWKGQVHAGLVGLGWSAKEADQAVEAVAPQAANGPPDVAGLLRAALRTLSRA